MYNTKAWFNNIIDKIAYEDTFHVHPTFSLYRIYTFAYLNSWYVTPLYAII